MLRGRVTADNLVKVYLNGVQKHLAAVGFVFDNWSEFVINDGFQAGQNVLELEVNNFEIAANPTGVRLEIDGTAATAATVLSGLSISPSTVIGGGGSTGTVSLNLAAPAGGLTIPLSSLSTAAQVPTSVTVAAGALGNTFPITTSTVTTAISAVIRASLAGNTFDQPLSVNPAAGPPAAPSSLTATATSATQVNLTWTDNSSNEAGFAVERASGGPFTQVATVNANLTSFADSGLTPSTNYSYRVLAYTSGGLNSAYSNTAPVSTPASSNVAFVTSGLPVPAGAVGYGWVTGWVGIRILTGASGLTIRELGRYAGTGHSGSHELAVFTTSGQKVGTETVSVALAGAPAGQFKYVTLATPLTLAANTYYYVVSKETAGVDDPRAIAVTTSPSTSTTIISGIYNNGGGW